jgi:hypothetical protein
MNYYSQGGQPHGLKSLAQELPKYGRYGDSIVAHINPQEAAMLKAMGGSGTINPVTGLPEFFIKKVTQPFVQAWKGVTNLPGIKQVSDAVTPVMQTIAPYLQYVAPFIPGVGPLMAAGIGALGAGFGKGQGGFNFKRALMGGMTAYGLGNLYAGLQAAAPLGADATASQVASSLGEGASSAAGSQADLLAQQAAGLGDAGLQNIASSGSYAYSPSAADIDVFSGLAGTAPPPPSQAAPLVFDKSLATSVPQSLQMPNLSSMPSRFATEMGNAGSGLQNLAGLGEGTMSEAAKAVGTKFGTGSAGAMFTGMSGTAALDEEQKYLDQQKAAGSIADTEYQEGIARIQAARKRAEEAVLANPYQFAMGGQVDDELGGDYSAMGMDQGNLQKGLFGRGYAEGGTPRFLSGGGDGMSDSIPATINGRQPARLADGEFVIPADVVSGIGNGSSKAGAKRLYGMMDRVRKDRTGTTKQAKAINPAKLMAA